MLHSAVTFDTTDLGTIMINTFFIYDGCWNLFEKVVVSGKCFETKVLHKGLKSSGPSRAANALQKNYIYIYIYISKCISNEWE
jgi:hypothetical protein